MIALETVLWLLAYSVLLGAVGYLPARWFFLHRPPFGSEKTQSSITVLAALLIGPMCFNLVVYFASLAFQIGVRPLAQVIFLALLLPFAIVMASDPRVRRDFIRCCAEARALLLLTLLVGLPLAGLYILWPMWTHSWLMAYSTGNDSVRYVMMIDYLQTHPWHWGVSGTSGPPIANFAPLTRCPLMYFFSATAGSLLPIGPYLAYSLCSIQSAFLLALSIAGLGLALFRQVNSWTFLVIALAVGTSGYFNTLYYTGFVGQFFAATAVIMVLWYLFFEDPWRQAAWLLLSSLAATLTYSTGMFLIALAMLLAAQAMRVVCRNQSIKSACYTVLIAAGAGLVAIAFGDSSFSVYASFSPKNPGYNYGLNNGMLIWFGLASKYEDLPSFTIRHRVELLVPLLMLCAFALWQAVRTFKGDGRFAGILLGYWAVMVAVYLRHDYFFFQKLITPAVPLLLVSVAAARWRAGTSRLNSMRGSWTSLAVCGALLWLALSAGWRLIHKFYVPLAEARQTYVDPAIIQMRNRLVSGNRRMRVYSVDASNERHLLLRQLFDKEFWWPDRDESTWGEFNLTDKNAPRGIFDGNYDLLIAAHDYRGPVDYRHLDEGSLVGPLGPLVDVFGAGSTIVEFDKEWSPGPWVALTGRKESSRAMQLDSKMGVVTLKVQGGRAPDMEIAVRSRAANNIRVFLNGVPVVPVLSLQGGGETTVFLKCSTLCRSGDNSMLWEQSGNSLELANVN